MDKTYKISIRYYKIDLHQHHISVRCQDDLFVLFDNTPNNNGRYINIIEHTDNFIFGKFAKVENLDFNQPLTTTTADTTKVDLEHFGYYYYDIKHGYLASLSNDKAYLPAIFKSFIKHLNMSSVASITPIIKNLDSLLDRSILTSLKFCSLGEYAMHAMTLLHNVDDDDSLNDYTATEINLNIKMKKQSNIKYFIAGIKNKYQPKTISANCIFDDNNVVYDLIENTITLKREIAFTKENENNIEYIKNELTNALVVDLL